VVGVTTLPDDLQETVEELVEEKVAEATVDLREENQARFVRRTKIFTPE
jgi:hypothetical protein